jgi:inhibitor of KinA sporulation pathway (predicted exonuclease)
MCKCGLNYQMDTLQGAYSNQHFDPIEYTCDVMNTLLQFKMQNFKSFINLDDFIMLSKLIKQSANIC